jgi:hypothetical protein
MNPELSIDFIRDQGNPLAHARLAYLLYHDTPSAEVVSLLVDGQRSDGGWSPAWSTNYSSLDATCFRFSLAHQLGLTASEVFLARGCAFVSQRQRNDGSWEEAKEEAIAAPVRVKPGRRSARLFLTANCGFWLSVLHANQSGVVRAASFLRSYLGKSHGLPSYIQSQCLGAGLFYRLKWFEYSDSLIDYIDGRIDQLPTGSLVWMLLSLVVAGLPNNLNLLQKGVAILESKQHRDGFWPGDGSTLDDIHTTLEALYVLRMCERF